MLRLKSVRYRGSSTLPPASNQNKNIMEKFLVKEYIGDFFLKMYQANKGKNMEITLMLNDEKIQIYNRDKFTFEDVKIIEERPTIDGLIKTLSE